MKFYQVFIFLAVILLVPWTSGGDTFINECEHCSKLNADPSPVNGKTAGTLKVLSELGPNYCQKIVATPECQEVYKDIVASGEELADYKRTCSEEEMSMELTPPLLSGNKIWGCALGLFDSTFGEAGNLIGTFAGYVITDSEINRECSTKLEYKKLLYRSHNSNMSKEEQVPIPADKVLNSYDCSDIKRSIAEEARYYKLKKMRRHGLSFTPEAGLMNLAAEKMREWNIRVECYNPRKSQELLCKTAGVLGVGVLAAAKIVKIQKLAGIYKSPKSLAPVKATAIKAETVSAADAAHDMKSAVQQVKEAGYTVKRDQSISLTDVKKEIATKNKILNLDGLNLEKLKALRKQLLESLQEAKAKDNSGIRQVTQEERQLKAVLKKIKEVGNPKTEVNFNGAPSLQYTSSVPATTDHSFAVTGHKYDISGGLVDKAIKDRAITKATLYEQKQGETVQGSFDPGAKRAELFTGHDELPSVLEHEIDHGYAYNGTFDSLTGLPQEPFDFAVVAQTDYAKANGLTGYRAYQHGSEVRAFRVSAKKEFEMGRPEKAVKHLNISNDAIRRNIDGIRGARKELKGDFDLNKYYANDVEVLKEKFRMYRIPIKDETGNTTHYFELRRPWKERQLNVDKEELIDFLNNLEKEQLKASAENQTLMRTFH